MSINVKQSIMVRPLKETLPRHTIWLSSLDFNGRTPYGHTPKVHVHCPSELEMNSSTDFFNTKIMTDALSRVLVPFFPMAGRLKENDSGRLEIDCNDEGVLYVEAETMASLSDFGDFASNSELNKLIIPKCDYSKGISSFPLVMVQLTRFECGGVTLGFALHHHLGDGAAYVHFINSWSMVARGLDIELMPVHERRPFLSPRDPPVVKFQHFFPRGLTGDSKTTTTTAFFELSKDQISALKQKVETQSINNYKPTTYEVLAAHIWRSTCKTRGLDKDQEIRLVIPTDLRSRLEKPALPIGFCGNAIIFASCILPAHDVVNNPLAYVAKKINETIIRMKDNEYLRSEIDHLETRPILKEPISGGNSIYPDIYINLWGRGMPHYEADFGWGRPMFVRHGGVKFEGQLFIMPNGNGDGGFSLSIRLFTHHMALFSKYLYDFDH